MSATVVVPVETKEEKKLRGKENAKGKPAENAKKGKAKVKEDVRRKWQAGKVVLKAIDPNQNAEGKLELTRKTKYLGRVLLRL